MKTTKPGHRGTLKPRKWALKSAGNYLSGAKVKEERYRAFIENIDDGVYEVDLQGNFVYFNNALCTVLGYPREDIQGQYFGKFMNEDRASAAFEIFNRIYRTEKGISDVLWETVDKAGNLRKIELSANLITDEAGEKIGFRGIARDVTEKVKAQEALRESELRLQRAYEASRVAEERYRTLLDFLPVPLVVCTVDGKVSYLNSAFSETFGWTLEELHGKHIPYVPPEIEEETRQNIDKLLKERLILDLESRRLTKDGRVLDVMMRGAVFTERNSDQAGEMILLRDITQEKRLAGIREAMANIGSALPAHPDLEELLDYISGEIRSVLNVEGALAILLDEERDEFFFLGAAYENRATELRAKEIRYPSSKGISGLVIRTGEPVIVHDTSKEPNFYGVIDQQMGAQSRSMLSVPMKSGDRIIGVLSAINKKEGLFDREDMEILTTIGATVALSIENARYSREIKRAYREVSSLNRAKDRIINHLSHELKTPISVLLACMNILTKRLANQPRDTWEPTVERVRRNLDRILAIQYEVEDIMRGKPYRTHELLNLLLDQCGDQLQAFAAEKLGEGSVVESIRSRIHEIYGPKETKMSQIALKPFLEERLRILGPLMNDREIEILTRIETVPDACIPTDVLAKVIDGLMRNAVEATPDEGRIEIILQKRDHGAELVVADCGIGITEENQARIFEGFFTTHETLAYSSKRPYQFNAGGKGADLLRTKIFAERYGFQIQMSSRRCPYLPKDDNLCPGRISECGFCRESKDCHTSGGTSFYLYFPPVPAEGCGASKGSPNEIVTP